MMDYDELFYVLNKVINMYFYLYLYRENMSYLWSEVEGVAGDYLRWRYGWRWG